MFAQILSPLLSKHQLSQSVPARLASCRILGKVVGKFESSMWVLQLKHHLTNQIRWQKQTVFMKLLIKNNSLHKVKIHLATLCCLFADYRVYRGFSLQSEEGPFAINQVAMPGCRVRSACLHVSPAGEHHQGNWVKRYKAYLMLLSLNGLFLYGRVLTLIHRHFIEHYAEKHSILYNTCIL